MTDPSQLATQVNQVDYIETLEDDLRRESQARRILTALLNQRTRTLQAYIERYGDITTENGDGDADESGAAVGGRDDDRGEARPRRGADVVDGDAAAG